jgi:hypothetical protein
MWARQDSEFARGSQLSAKQAPLVSPLRADKATDEKRAGQPQSFSKSLSLSGSAYRRPLIPIPISIVIAIHYNRQCDEYRQSRLYPETETLKTFFGQM